VSTDLELAFAVADLAERSPSSVRWRFLPDALVAVDAAALRAFGESTSAVMGRRIASMSGVLNVVRRSFHGRHMTRRVGRSVRALEARKAVRRRGNCAARSFACGRAGDGGESRRARPRTAADDRGRAAWSASRLPRTESLRCLVGLPSSNEG
jgi:hypothetical protein